MAVRADQPRPPSASATTQSIDAVAAVGGVPDAVAQIADRLRSDDPKDQGEAVDQIREMLRTDQQHAVGLIRSSWLKRLMQLQRYDDVADLSLLTILASPADTYGVEQLQTYRVQAFLAAGKAPEALAAARQLFDVSTLKGTADAVRTVCECLNALHPGDRSLLRRYRQEQIDGSRTTSTPAAANPSSLTLSAIQIDPTPYAPAIRAITAEDYRSLVGEGNLLLLAGNSKDAWDVFERAYTMASDKDLAAASENLARCMKAQDGTIGRANAFVLSIRPKAQLASDRSTAAALATTQASQKE